MKALFQTIGVIALLIWSLGALGVFDVRLCIGLPGKCSDMSIPYDRPATRRQA